MIQSLPDYYHTKNRLIDRVRVRLNGRKYFPGFESFATHIPILLAMEVVLRPKKVLELGPGLHSTPMFLNQECMGSIEKFVSVESEKEWFDKVSGFFQNKPFGKLILEEAGVDGFTKRNKEKFDLIFVDDSLTTEGRVKSLLAVSDFCGVDGKTIVVIHDFEVPEYQAVTSSFKSRYIFKIFRPSVGVVWNESEIINVDLLKEIERQIGGNRWRISVTDIASWKKLFSRVWNHSIR